MNTHEWPCRIKSARQKRRLVKTDRDKQLIQLYKRRKELRYQQSLLPMVPLEHPYQRGWKRFFVLRDNLKHSQRAAFYETLLAKINTVEYHYDKSFKRKKRRKKCIGYEMRQQLLREFYPYNWQVNRMNLTEEEKACFTCVETFDIKTRRVDVKYVFTEPWRYILKVVPDIITHKKLLDIDIERELARVKNRINTNFLTPRMDYITHGRLHRWRGGYSEPAKYINKIKNIPRYSPKEAYLELET